MKSLVLAEKPSVAKEIARVLGCKNKQQSYFEGRDYIVTWALGHLVTLAEPEDYDPRYKTWKLEDLPILPKEMKLKPIRETSRQFRAVSQLCRRNDVKELIIATDAGREGELVARWVMEMVRWKKPFRRLWISSQTDQAIKQGFAQLRPGRQYDALYDSAVCRAEADWFIGLNLTRALTTKYNEQLAAGRVQTPTLAMMVKREDEIKQFQSQEFYRIAADFGNFKGRWRGQAGRGDDRIFERERAEHLQKKLNGKAGEVRSVSSTDKTEPQPLPYDLTELQRDANRRYQFSAKKTSSVLQKLYESHKLVTYPRTDSKHLSSDMTSTLTDRLQANQVGEYADLIRPVIRNGRVPKRVINNEKVTDHHAIIPTEEPLNLSQLTSDERKLYDLIVRRYIALFYPIHRYKEVKVAIQVEGETFQVSGRQVMDAGWKAVYGADEAYGADHTNQVLGDDSGPDPRNAMQLGSLPTVKKGQKVAIKRCELQQDRTSPPPRYNEAELLSVMEKHDLGTPATRADIIERLLATDTITRQNNRLQPTGKGLQLVQLVSEQLRSPDMTAKWERQLERIAKGNGNKQEFLAGIRKQAAGLVQEVKRSTFEYKPHNVTNRHCPDCGEPLKERKGRRGSTLICINRECDYRRSEQKTFVQKRCPQCRKRMELRFGKAGKFVHCRSCNVVEVLEDSPKNLRNQRNQARNLVKKYSKDTNSLGSSLGDALKEAMQQKKK